jgi:hypothetical protein
VGSGQLQVGNGVGGSSGVRAAVGSCAPLTQEEQTYGWSFVGPGGRGGGGRWGKGGGGVEALEWIHRKLGTSPGSQHGEDDDHAHSDLSRGRLAGVACGGTTMMMCCIRWRRATGHQCGAMGAAGQLHPRVPGPWWFPPIRTKRKQKSHWFAGAQTGVPPLRTMKLHHSSDCFNVGGTGAVTTWHTHVHHAPLAVRTGRAKRQSISQRNSDSDRHGRPCCVHRL